jgi:putative ABC transport system permease protein
VRPHIAPFWLRSVRARPTSFVSLALLSAAALILSVLAPLLLGSVNAAALADATSAEHGKRITVTVTAEIQDGDIKAPLTTADLLVAKVGGVGLWGPTREVVRSTTPLRWAPAVSAGTSLGSSAYFRAAVGHCTELRMVSGTCPKSTMDILIPASVTAAQHLTIGSHLELVPSGTRFTVSGTYRGGSDLVLSDQGFEESSFSGVATTVRALTRPLTPQNVAAAQADVARARNEALRSGYAATGARVTSGLSAVLAIVAQREAAAAVLVEVVALEALGMAWFSVALITQRTAQSRAVEWGLGRLRGLSRRRRLASRLAEPAIAVGVGSALGAAAAPLVALGIARSVLGDSATVQPIDLSVAAALALAVIGSVVAVVFGVSRSARLPLVVALRETAEPRALSRVAFAVQGGVILATLIALYSLLTQDVVGSAQTAVAVPGLIGLSVALIAAQLVLVRARRAGNRTTKSLVSLVVGRRLARTPSLLAVGVLVSVGVAIVVYQFQVAPVALRLEQARAAAAVGAGTVLHVSVPGTVSFLHAVRGADPTGRAAMAVEEVTNGSGPARIIAVDSSRLGAVSTWSATSDGLSAAHLNRLLAPAAGRPLTVTGTSLTLSFADLSGTGSAGGDTTLALDLVVQNASGWHDILLGQPRNGTVVRSIPCSTACRVVYLGLADDGASPSPFDVRVSLTSALAGSTPLPSWLDAANWRNRVGDAPATYASSDASVSRVGRALSLNFSDKSGGNTASIAPRDAPEPLPVITRTTSDFVPFDGMHATYLGNGLDGSYRLIRVVGHSDLLPRIGGSGVMVDLSQMDKIINPTGDKSDHQVWLTPGNHAAVLSALEREGLRITSTETLAATTASYEREAPIRAAEMGEAVGAAALLAALLGMIAARAISAPSRRRDVDTLRETGLTERQLRRVLVVDAFAPVAGGAVVGLVSGFIAFLITVRHLPLLAADGAVPAVSQWSTPGSAVAVICAVLVALLIIALIQAALDLRERNER